MFVLSVYKTSHTCHNDNVHRRYAQQPDEQCGNDRYPDGVTVYLGRFCHGESRGCDKGHYCRTDSLEYILYYLVLLELLEEQGDCQHNKEGGEYGTQGHCQRPTELAQFISDEYGYVYSEYSGHRLSEGQ